MYIGGGREVPDVHWRGEEIPDVHWRGEGDTVCTLEGGGQGKLGYFIVNFWGIQFVKIYKSSTQFYKKN